MSKPREFERIRNRALIHAGLGISEYEKLAYLLGYFEAERKADKLAEAIEKSLNETSKALSIGIRIKALKDYRGTGSETLDKVIEKIDGKKCRTKDCKGEDT